MNDTSENALTEALNTQKVICMDNKLKQLIVRDDRRFKDKTDP
jgi:hypothetical protein